MPFGNTPYCRRCHRQVSFKRPFCRSCGASLYAPKAPPPPPEVAVLRAAERARDDQIRKEAEEWQGTLSALGIQQSPRDDQIRKEAEEWRLEQERWQAAREAEREARRAARDAFYRSRGIEPGPLAWFQSLPEVAQAILLGLSFGLPAGGVAWAIFASW